MTIHESDLIRLGISDKPIRDRVTQEPIMNRLRRLWLLYLRWHWNNRAEEHGRLAGECYRKRQEAIAELAEQDEPFRGRLW